MKAISFLVASLWITGCQTDAVKIQSPQVITGGYTHRINFDDVAYYLTGPQQARPPEGSFNRHARVRLVRNAGSYSQVESETGSTAFVSTGALEELPRK